MLLTKDFKMKNNLKINSKATRECPFRQTLETLDGKWKFAIIYELLKENKYRFKELERQVEGITPRMLIKELKALEKSDIILRKQYPTVPPKVEYSLTEHGKKLRANYDDYE